MHIFELTKFAQRQDFSYLCQTMKTSPYMWPLSSWVKPLKTLNFQINHSKTKNDSDRVEARRAHRGI